MSDQEYTPFATQNALLASKLELEVRLLREYRRLAYVPDDCDDEAAWAQIGRFLAINFEHDLKPRRRGRPKAKKSMDLRRFLVAASLVEDWNSPLNELNKDASEGTWDEIIKRASGVDDKLFPLRADRTIENSLRRGARQYEAIQQEIHRLQCDLEDLLSLAERHDDQSALDDAERINARIKSLLFSIRVERS